eukprot:5671489-Pyramimonas_sp.AAC.1
MRAEVARARQVALDEIAAAAGGGGTVPPQGISGAADLVARATRAAARDQSPPATWCHLIGAALALLAGAARC